MPNGQGETAADYAWDAARTAQKAASQAATQAQSDVAYLHARIDQLIRQTALEIGLLHSHRTDLSTAATDGAIRMAHNRFVAADNAAAEQCNRPRRTHP